ncbi:ABC transporter ATP-binding protein [Sulfoacidibacillus ferrooxidans]|uniref:Oligopeptide transport ATP-binding protein OppF n=1 Tax=Sulfoacidibacillus ferrooxidans TaxID=2005001 RepID=A0A9X1V733_9BACL|nr:dipeptide ABC transporter ATP-binding protein [Sulfoacidibacillus ferrooxidans]MCI0182851.1 Oligopeptide transport ATP-binding protein OppF [Sulfoacidibacillus ferrooxidans]
MSTVETKLTEKPSASQPLLQVDHVKKYFPIMGGVLRHTVGQVKAVDDVSFTLNEGETLGLVGESGCGKSTLGRVIMRIYEPTEGTLSIGGQDISHVKGEKLRKLRHDFQMVFQDPYSSLNPRMSVGALVAEPLIVNKRGTRSQIQDEVVSLLATVGLNPEARVRYPHEFSGGQRQRIAIARALALHPKLIVADEAVSALDVSIQAQILNLLSDLRKEFGLSYVFISHNLAVVKHVSDRVAVMYLGRLVELAPKGSLYTSPLHPYTQALLSAAPEPKRHVTRERIVLVGDVPSPAKPPNGCAFHTRCPKVMDVCRSIRPELEEYTPGQYVACHLYS